MLIQPAIDCAPHPMWRRVGRSDAAAGEPRSLRKRRIVGAGVPHSRRRVEARSCRERRVRIGKNLGGSMRRFLLAILVVALPFFLSSPVLAQITGDITGHVLDEQGGPMPGVTVEGRSPAFQGVRTAVTDATGTYRLILLPPGVYKITASLQGFARAESTITVALGKTSTGDFQLRPSATAEVVVSATAP